MGMAIKHHYKSVTIKGYFYLHKNYMIVAKEIIILKFAMDFFAENIIIHRFFLSNSKTCFS